MVFLVIPLLLLWSLIRRRCSLVIGFVLAMLVLVGSGWVLVPGWVSDYLIGVLRYDRYVAYGGPTWLLTEYYFRFLGRPANAVLTLALVGYLVWQWWGIWRFRIVDCGLKANEPEIRSPRSQLAVSWSAFWWVVGLTLIVTQLVAPRTATTNYVILYIPLLLIFHAACTYFRWGHWYVLTFELVSLLGFWALFAATVVAERGGNLPQEDPIMYLPLPILLLLAFVLGRGRLMCPEESSV